MVRNILVFIFISLSFSSFAQRSLRYGEYTGWIGTMNHRGDLATKGDPGTYISEVRPQFGVGAYQFYTPKFGMGFTGGMGWIYANGSNHDTIYKNIEVRSRVITLDFQLVYNFSKFGKYYQRNSGTFYILGGIGASFAQAQPYTYMADTNTVLTSGSNSGFSYSLGFGYKFRIAPHHAMKIEFVETFYPSDNIEGFTNLNSTGGDRYFGIRVGYMFLNY